MTLLVQITLFHLLITAILTLASFYLQYVSYPRLKSFSGEEFVAFHKKTSNMIFVFFSIFIFLEATSFCLMISVDNDASYFEWLPFVFIMVAIWIITFLFMLKIDDKLKEAKHDKVIKELIKWNWIRIGLWSAKTLVLAFGIVKNIVK